MKNEEARVHTERQIIYYIYIYIYIYFPLPIYAQFTCYGQQGSVHYAAFLAGGERRCPLRDGRQRAGDSGWQSAGEGGSCSGRGT